ncbi:MAG TPA: hypothetical protein VMW38_25455 [Terriglobia bacterium]|nr:hypothetical protein [Terriglobia bacterium]
MSPLQGFDHLRKVKAHSVAAWGQFSQTAMFNTVIAGVQPSASLPQQFILLQN